MTDLKQAATLALEALETYKGFIDDAHIIEGQWHWLDGSDNAITALRKALEQPQQEPVAWICYGAPGKRDIDFEESDINKLPIGTPLYTTPPAAQPEQVDCPRCGHVCSQRPWQGLTDEEVAIASAEFDTKLKLAFHAGMYKAQIILRKKNDPTY